MTYKIETPKTHMHKDETNIFKHSKPNSGKLSDFENDLFYNHRIPVINIAKDDLVEIEIDGNMCTAYVHDGLWPGEFTPDKIAYNYFWTSEIFITEEELSMFVMEDGVLGTDSFVLVNGILPEYPNKTVLLIFTQLVDIPDTFKFVLYSVDAKQIPSEVLECTDIVVAKFDEESQWFVESNKLRKLKLLTEDAVMNARESDVFVPPYELLVNIDGYLFMQHAPTFTYYVPTIIGVSKLEVGGTTTLKLSRDINAARFNSDMEYRVSIEESDNIVYTLLDTPHLQGRNAVATHTGKVFKSHRIDDPDAITIVITRLK